MSETVEIPEVVASAPIEAPAEITDEPVLPSGAEVEQELLKREAEASKPLTQDDIDEDFQKKLEANIAESENTAATIFALKSPHFFNLLERLSANALKRVLKKLVTYPLNTKDYRATSNLEQEVFNTGNALLESKYLMIIGTYIQSQQLAKGVEEKVEESVKEGETNVVSNETPTTQS